MNTLAFKEGCFYPAVRNNDPYTRSFYVYLNGSFRKFNNLYEAEYKKCDFSWIGKAFLPSFINEQ